MTRLTHPRRGLVHYLIGAGIVAVIADAGPVAYLIVAAVGVLLVPFLNGLAYGFAKGLVTQIRSTR